MGDIGQSAPGRQSPAGEKSEETLASERMAKARGGAFCAVVPGSLTLKNLLLKHRHLCQQTCR